MRLFVASRLNEDNRRALAARREAVVQDFEGRLRAVPEGSEHLTHLFLGEREETLEDFVAALAPIARMTAFAIALGEAAVFPSRGNPRLVCLQVVDQADRVRALSAAVHRQLALHFPDLAEQPLKHPHVTLARFSRGARLRDGRRVEALLASAGLARWRGRDRLGAVDIIESRLSAQGATYEVLASIALDGSEPRGRAEDEAP